MKANELTFTEIKILNSVGQKPWFNKKGIENEARVSNGTVASKLNKFRKNELVVKAPPELRDDNFRWLLTGKGVGMLKDALYFHLQELKLDLKMKSQPTYHIYRPDPQKVEKVYANPIEKTISHN